MHNANIIELRTLEWTSPVVIVPNAEGLYHMCIYYKKVNADTVHDTYTLGRLDACIDSLLKATFFSSLDAKSRFW